MEIIKEYMPYIIGALQIIATIILFIINLVKRKKDGEQISINECLNEILPSLINSAEQIFTGNKTGQQKKYYVLTKVKEITNSKTAVNMASKKIEEFLATPQKKGN